MRYLFFLVLFCISLICSADIYTRIDKNGNISYSDTPLGTHSVKIKAPEVSTVPSTSTQQDQQQDNSLQSSQLSNHSAPIHSKKPYTTFTISSPAEQETLQNQPMIVVKVVVAPPLQEGDTIQLFLDGTPWGDARATTQFELTAPNRGTHQLSAKILDSNMQILKVSNSNTIYVHQAHVGT